MALANLRSDYTPAPAGPAASHFDGDRIRRELVARHPAEQVAPQVEKWAPRNAVGLIVVSSAALWVALIYGGVQLVRLAF
jgi:hypothetical protein